MTRGPSQVRSRRSGGRFPRENTPLGEDLPSRVMSPRFGARGVTNRVSPESTRAVPGKHGVRRRPAP